MANLEPAVAALAAHAPQKIFEKLRKLDIWWWERDEQRFSRDRWKSARDVRRALDERDPWLAANAIQLLAELDPKTAASIAVGLVNEKWRKNDLDELAKNQAVGALWSTAHHVPLETLLSPDVARHLDGDEVSKVYARIPAKERPRVLQTLLRRDLEKSPFPRDLRAVLALESIGTPETIRALGAAILDDRHPAQESAAEWLYRGGSAPALRALVAYLERGGKRPGVRAASIGAAARLGPETANRLLLPIVRDAKARSFERASGFDSVQQAIAKKQFPKDDADWIRAGLDALAGKKGEIAEAARRMLAVMSDRAVDAAAKAKPAAKKPKPAKGSAARTDDWLDGFESDVRHIVKVLGDRGYTFAAKQPITPAAKTARRSLDELEKKLGVALPWSLRAFWERFDSVDLREDTEGMNDLPELGKLDPLVIVSLAEARKYLAFDLKARARMPRSVRPPLWLYLAPDRWCKYDPDGNEANEEPLELALEGERRADGTVRGRGVKQTFLGYLRKATATGGFLALEATKDPKQKALRVALVKGLKGF